MKLGPLEGTTEEIKNFFENSGLRVSDYIALPDSPIATVWFVVPGVVLLVAIGALVFLAPLKAAPATFVFLVGCGAGLWLAVTAQLRFKSPMATGVIVLGCLLLMLVALGAVTPIEMLQEVKALKK